MGAKAPAKLKLRRPLYKCNICDRKMLSVQALKTHKYCIHNINEEPQKAGNPTVKLKVYKPAVIKSATSKSVQRQESSKEEQFESPKTKVSDVRRIEFECPQCKRWFGSYFSAFRHIKKHHCSKSDGNKSKQSAKVPMPVRLEVCVKCNQRIGSDIHVCHEAMLPLGTESILNYMCTGCNQKFLSIQLFDLHVAGLHTDDGVESMFFPQMNEFLTWKNHMETQLNIRYLVLGKCTSKQTFHCTFLNAAETVSPETEAHICPSSIVVQEFSKGIQVHYYKKHYGHPCPEYTLSEDYKKYSITSLMKQTPEHYKNITTDVESDEKDLYIQFKTLMESIVVDAAKIKIDSLKIILGKALEMTSVLTNYDEDDETITYSNNKSLTDDQIASALEKLRSKKRKSDLPIPKEIVKKAKPADTEFVSPKIVNSFSVAEMDDIDKGMEVLKDYDSAIIKKPMKMDTPPLTPKDDNSKLFKKVTKVDTPTSFNDSYKDFVDKNFINRDENNTKSPTPKNVQKRNNVPIRTYEGPELRRSRAEKDEKEVIAKEVSIKPKEIPIKPKEIPIKPREVPIKPKEVPIKPKEVPIKPKEIPIKPKDLPVVTKDVAIKSKEVLIKPKDVPTKIKEVPVKTKEVKLKEIEIKTKEIPIKTKECLTKTKATPIKTKETPVKIKEVPIKKDASIKAKEAAAKTKGVKSKKNIVKTKIGQFKPSISPKKSELNKSIDKLKINFDYEVKEQENDCNILILKI